MESVNRWIDARLTIYYEQTIGAIREGASDERETATFQKMKKRLNLEKSSSIHKTVKRNRPTMRILYCILLFYTRIDFELNAEFMEYEHCEHITNIMRV